MNKPVVIRLAVSLAVTVVVVGILYITCCRTRIDSSEDFYIALLRDIKKTPQTETDIRKKYPEQARAIFNEVGWNGLLAKYEDNKYRLSFDSRFKLLEYDKMLEARESSKQAKFYAIIAIFFTGVSIFIDLCFRLKKQLKQLLSKLVNICCSRA